MYAHVCCAVHNARVLELAAGGQSLGVVQLDPSICQQGYDPLVTPDPSNERSYRYGPRIIGDMSARALRAGDGRISGALSSVLGLGSLLGVLCFRFPEYLTTPELREVYDPEWIRIVLKLSMWAALVAGLWSLVRRKRRPSALVGVVGVTLAWALGGYGVESRPVQPSPVFAGVDWMLLDLLGSAFLFILIEKIRPKYSDQVIFRPDWRMDLWYFALNHLFVGVFFFIGNSFAPLVFGWATHDDVQAWMQSTPLWVQVPILVLVADLVQYWVHRMFHEVPALWHFHAVHHCTEHMDWLAGSRTHVFQTIVDRSLVMVPLYLLGPSLDALNLYVAIAAFQAVFVHANFGGSFGPLRFLVVTPQFHHWHHAKDDPAIDTNYAVHTPVYDLLFGSFHLPKDHWPKEYGTVSPLPKTFLGQLAYPFRRQPSITEESPQSPRSEN